MPELLTKADLPEIIERYRQGESLQVLATQTPVKVRQLYNWIIRSCEPVYRDAQEECLVNRIADADMALENASNAIQLARAREAARFARMDLERRRPELYGPKSEVKQDLSITVHVHREPQVIDTLPLGNAQLLGNGNDNKDL